MGAIFAALLAALPHVALRLVMPFLTEAMMEEVAKKALGSALRKMASLTETTTDDQAVEFIIRVWENSRGDK